MYDVVVDMTSTPRHIYSSSEARPNRFRADPLALEVKGDHIMYDEALDASEEHVIYPNRISHPISQSYLPMKLAEYIGDNFAE